MTDTIMLGVLSLVGELAGSHVHVTVLGAGQLGSRPLCGKFVVTIAEWSSLHAIIDVLTAADKRHAADRAQVDVLKQECRELRSGWRHEILENGYAWQETATLREMLVDVLGSAVPNERDHPAMSKQWARADALLRKAGTGG